MAQDIKIENVVASTEFDGRIPLNRLATELENTEYEPEQFPGLVYRLKEPKAAALLFSSGKVVCTGTKSPEQVKEAVMKIIDELEETDVYRETDFSIENEPKIKVQNIVASSNIGEELKLNRIAFELVGSEYEPEQFPGLVYRLEEPKVAFLLFSTGEIVCTGGSTIEDVEDGVETLKEKLREVDALSS